MMYRAKITKIQSWVESVINTNCFPLVRDANDVYIEVPDEELADLLEQINKGEQVMYNLKYQFFSKFIDYVQ